MPDVTALRLMLGDTDQAIWTDDDLEAALTAAEGYNYRAAGDLISSLAVQYAQQGKAITTDDLAINVTSRGPNLLAVARSFYTEHAAVLAQDAANVFTLIPHTDPACGPGEGQPNAYPWVPDSTYPLLGNGWLGYL